MVIIMVIFKSSSTVFFILEGGVEDYDHEFSILGYLPCDTHKLKTQPT